MKTKIEHLKGKRIGALDYGRKRVGFAVCDELHIITSPRKTYSLTDEKFWDILLDDINKENLAAIVLGIPYRIDENEETDIIMEIKVFADELKLKTGLEIFLYDEAYSTHRATETLIQIGKKKKKRSKKGEKDKIAAAIILQDFLHENE